MLIGFLKKYFIYFFPIFLVFTGIFQPFNYLFVLISFFLFWKRPSFVTDINILFLSTFTLFYNLSTETGGPIGRSASILLPISFYIFGKYLSGVVYPRKGTNLLLITFFIIFNSWSLISYLYNIYNYGFNFDFLRLLGSDQDYLALTNFASYFAFNMALFPLFNFSPKYKSEKRVKQLSQLLAIIGIVVVGSIGQRTGFFIILISLTTYLFINRSRVLKNLNFRFIFYILGIFLANVLIGWEWIEKTRIYQRMFLDDSETGIISTRSDIWESAFKLFISNPFGGQGQLKHESFTYAHNLWIDVGLKAGILPLIPLLILSILLLLDLLKLYSSKLENLTKLLFLLSSTAIYCTFMVEPIMEGYTNFFLAFTFIFGALKGTLSYTK